MSALAFASPKRVTAGACSISLLLGMYFFLGIAGTVLTGFCQVVIVFRRQSASLGLTTVISSVGVVRVGRIAVKGVKTDAENNQGMECCCNKQHQRQPDRRFVDSKGGGIPVLMSRYQSNVRVFY